ncbi:MAG: hypothetical protein LUC86_02365 [Prevotellaceae bacterium]|nr:hypothetical protein [Prevotellaceae bacterium]
MNEINDKELDEIIQEAVLREAACERICKGVERQLRRERGKALWRRWAPRLAFSILVPLVVCLWAWLSLFVYREGWLGGGGLLLFLPGLAALTFGLNYAISEFRKVGSRV